MHVQDNRNISFFLGRLWTIYINLNKNIDQNCLTYFNKIQKNNAQEANLYKAVKITTEERHQIFSSHSSDGFC